LRLIDCRGISAQKRYRRKMARVQGKSATGSYVAKASAFRPFVSVRSKG